MVTGPVLRSEPWAVQDLSTYGFNRKLLPMAHCQKIMTQNATSTGVAMPPPKVFVTS